MKIYSIPLNEIHPFYDGNGRTSKVLLTSDEKKKLTWTFVVLNAQTLQKVHGKINCIKLYRSKF